MASELTRRIQGCISNSRRDDTTLTITVIAPILERLGSDDDNVHFSSYDRLSTFAVTTNHRREINVMLSP